MQALSKGSCCFCAAKHALCTGAAKAIAVCVLTWRSLCVCVQLLEWWYTSAEEKLAAEKKLTPPPPPPPPLPSPDGVSLPADPSICPLCRQVGRSLYPLWS